MNFEVKKYIISLYYGKFFHLEKISEMLYKRYDLMITEEQIQELIDRLEAFIRSDKA